MRETFWKKIEETKKKGISLEDFEKIESLESAIAYHQNEIDNYEKEIQAITEGASTKPT